jgi:hypothetical protein
VTPNSCCDRNGGPVPPAHSRSAAPVQPEAIPLPEPFRDRPSASTGQEAGPPPHSATRPLLRPCPGPVASAQRSVDSRRSPGNGQAAQPQPQRSASVDRWPPTMPAAADGVPDGAREGAPGAAQVGGIPAAWLVSPQQLHSAPGGIWDCAEDSSSVAESAVESTRYGFNWDCAECSRSAPIMPMKSAPCTPNSDCAMSQGSRFNGAGKRSGSGGGSTTIRAWIRRPEK